MNAAINNLVAWRLVIFKYISGCTKVGLMAFLGATVSVRWDQIGGFEKFCIIAAGIVQMLTYTEGFLDQTATKLAAGKPPIGTTNTETFTKDPVSGVVTGSKG